MTSYEELMPWERDYLLRTEWLIEQFRMRAFHLRQLMEADSIFLCDVCGQPVETYRSALCSRCAWEVPGVTEQ